MADGEWLKALAEIDRLLLASPGHSHFLGHRGLCLRKLGRLGESEMSFRRLTDLDVGNAAAWNSLGNVLKEMGRSEDALVALEKAAQLGGNLGYFSDWLFAQNYSPEIAPEAIYQAHRNFERAVSAAKREQGKRPARKEGRLKLGFVSADFCRHSVSYFLRPLLAKLSRNRFELHAFSGVTQPDTTTEVIKAGFDCWHEVACLSDDRLVDLIESTGIDILVDLSGHTGGNRLPVFAAKPAPLQITWLGYPNTTGLEAVDFRLVDSVTDPIGDADKYHAETLLRMKAPFLCYEGVNLAKPCAKPAGRPFTFGCFNHAAKIGDALLELWAEILLRCPDARLVLKNKALADRGVADHYRSVFSEKGVDVQRLTLLPPTDSELEHLQGYGFMDLALDTYPYHGTTTTCEALWMGVPVLTLQGDRHVSRVGCSLLASLGLTAFVADSKAAYVEKAVAACQGRHPLPPRPALRGVMERSTLCDAAGFARRFENAVLEAWRARVGEIPLQIVAEKRRVLVNGVELTLQRDPGPEVLNILVQINQTLPKERELVSLVADGRSLGGEELETAHFQQRLEITLAWNVEALGQRQAQLDAQVPAILAEASAFALGMAKMQERPFLQRLSGLLERLAPQLEMRAHWAEAYHEKGDKMNSSLHATSHEALLSVMNRIMDAINPRQLIILERLLRVELPACLKALASTVVPPPKP